MNRGVGANRDIQRYTSYSFFSVYTPEKKINFNYAFTHSFPTHGRSLLADVAAGDPCPLLLRPREKRTGRQRGRCPRANNARHTYRTVAEILFNTTLGAEEIASKL